VYVNATEEEVRTNYFTRTDIKYSREQLQEFGDVFSRILDNPIVGNHPLLNEGELKLVLERHGQNKEIKFSQPEELEDFYHDFAGKLDWCKVEKLELALTWEIYPLGCSDIGLPNTEETTHGSFFLGTDGVFLLFLFRQSNRNLILQRSPKTFHGKHFHLSASWYSKTL
jgi:hypothetical protein